MKKFFVFLKRRPLALISVFILALLYLMMILAEFNAPYSQIKSFEDKTYHPANLKFVNGKLVAQEARVINQITWKYAFVKDLYHPVGFFVKGDSYKLLGFIPCDRHLIGTKDNSYPLFILGADNLGRDLFSRIVYGSRISLTIGFVATAISLLLAIVFGGFAGYYGGKTDWAIMRISEFFMLIPGLYLILFLRSLLSGNMDSGQSYIVITLILSLVGWPGTARTIRGLVHSIKREEFVLNAQLEGTPSLVIIFTHIIPQIASLLIVSTALSVPGFIMSETTLSYLGLGIADPAVSWGSLIKRDISTLSNLKNYPWLLCPVYFLLTVTLAFNFLGDALRDFFDPYHAVFPKLFSKKKSDKKCDKLSDRKVVKSLDVKYDTKSESKSDNNMTELNDDILLCVKDLNVTFDVFRGNVPIKINAVRGISFELKKGEVLGIVGESGSGKSVSTSAITGLLPANANVLGQIYYDKINMTSLSYKEMREYRGKKIGMIFQEPSRSFDPLQNIGNVFYETIKNSNPKIKKEQAYEQAIKLLEETGITNAKERLSNFPHQFSGGQLQRISIALSLAQGCELLIADEPTTALDVTIQNQIVELLKKLQAERNLSIIFISHNIDLVSEISDKLIVMYGGLIMEQGDVQTVLTSPQHPYTKALLKASPKFGSHYTEEKLFSIPGKVTDPSKPENGCPFAPRCNSENKSSECTTKDFIKKVCYGK